MSENGQAGVNWAGAAVLLSAAFVVLAGATLFLLSQAPPPAAPTPSPTAAAPASPSPSAPPSPTASPLPTTSAQPSPTTAPSPSSGPTTSPAASPSPSPSPIASPSPSPTPPAAWIEVSDFPTYRGTTEVESITAGGPGFVAVGSGGRSLRARVWTSADGLSWTAEADDVFRGFSLHLVTRAGGELYAFGRGHEGVQIWRSANGRTWTALEATPLEWASINDVAVVGDTMIAVGSIYDVEAGDEGSAAWRSTDGIAWQRVAAPGNGEPWAAAVKGTTVVVVDRFAPLHGDAAIHYSTDLGDSWQAAQTDFPIDEDKAPGLVSVAADERRFVAVGYGDTFDYPPIAARSAEGTNWNSRRPAGINLLGQVVALRGGGFLALEGRGMRALISGNGRDWSEVAPLRTDRPTPPPPAEGGDEVVTTRVLAANSSGVVVAQPWGDGVVVWFGPQALFGR